MILDKYLLRQFFPAFILAISMFVFLLLLVDIFSNLVRYLNNEVPFSVIMQITFYYIPKSISYALPISLLFAAAYTLGDLYAKNELTSIFSSGIPFWRFSASLLLVGAVASVFSFFLDDVFVIPALKIKNDLSRRALNQYVADEGMNIAIRAKNGRVIYSVDYFDYARSVLNGVEIIEADEEGKFLSRIRAQSAEWNESYWEFINAVIYSYEDGFLRVKPLPYLDIYDEHPDVFRRSAVNVEELSVNEAGLLVQDLRAAGLPYTHALSNYYHRFSFSVTPLIVMLLSIPMGGRFRKNILLMSLFASLSIAVIYYIAEMLSMTMAGLNLIPPVMGAWFPVILFIFIGIILLRYAKT